MWWRARCRGERSTCHRETAARTRATTASVALGGLVKLKVDALGALIEMLVKPTENAGCEVLVRDQISTRSGIDVLPSSAIRTEPIKDRLSRGVRSSWYAGRPATSAVRSTLTAVDGSIFARACSAAFVGSTALAASGVVAAAGLGVHRAV